VDAYVVVDVVVADDVVVVVFLKAWMQQPH